MAGAHVQIYLWTFDRGWPHQCIIQKCMSVIYDVNVEGNSLVMCSWFGAINSKRQNPTFCVSEWTHKMSL
jgi:hypothetical protein